MIIDGAAGYRAALEELAAATAKGGELAELLDYFAGQLRGERPEPEAPPLEAYPGRAAVCWTLAKIDSALRRAEDEYDRLPPAIREELPDPLSVLTENGCV